MSYTRFTERKLTEKRVVYERRRQAGIGFPAPRDQNYAIIVRFDIVPAINHSQVTEGLHRLGTLLEEINVGLIVREEKTSEGNSIWTPLKSSNFTATIGFGKRFFEKCRILNKSPKSLIDMPTQTEVPNGYPYVLQQTDMILQLASNDYTVNRMVLQNDQYLFHKSLGNPGDGVYDSKDLPLDIARVLGGWARIIDTHSGFRRTDGRNLMGFYDGISNQDRLGNDFWISKDDYDFRYADGTFMVFQKIEHDLKQWRSMDIQAQERWVGRSKTTGLLLGTISPEEEKRLESEIHSSDENIHEHAIKRVAGLLEKQRDPKISFFDPYDARYFRISKSCPSSSHVRMANPRERKPHKQQELIFRRGYLYTEEQAVDDPRSGLLFISFQKDIKTFEHVARSLSLQNEMQSQKKLNSDKMKYSGKILTSPSFNTKTLGGGYYFIPPIPNNKISDIGQEFFIGL